MRGNGLVALVVLAILLLLPALDAADPDDRVVTYTYWGSGELAGTAEGSCDSYGAILAPTAEVDLLASDVSLVTAVVWVNQTSSHAAEEPVVLSTPVDYDRKEYARSLTDGTYTINGNADATIVFRPHGHPLADKPTMKASFAGHNVAWTSIGQGVSTAPHYTGTENLAGPQTLFNGLGYHDGNYPTGARGFVFQDGHVTVTGATVLHLRQTTIIGPDIEIHQPSYQTEVDNTTAPLDGAKVTTHRLEEAYLHVGNFSADWALEWVTLACGNLDSRITGNLTAYHASGTGTLVNETMAFDGQVLQLSGAFDISERLAPDAEGGEVRVRATGDIEVVGVDFQTALDTRLPSAVTLQVGAGLIVLGLLAAAKKGLPAVTVLFTRVSDHDIDTHPMRKQILAVLAERPVVGQTALVEAIGGSRGTVRHHAEVLSRAKRIRVIVIAGQRLFSIPGHDENRLRMEIVRNDERLRAVQEGFDAGLTRPKVTEHVAQRLGMTSRAARRHVQRFEALIQLPDMRGDL